MYSAVGEMTRYKKPDSLLDEIFQNISYPRFRALCSCAFPIFVHLALACAVLLLQEDLRKWVHYVFLPNSTHSQSCFPTY